MTPQMFIQARLEKDRLDLGSGMRSLDTVSINVTVIYDLRFMEYAFAVLCFHCTTADMNEKRFMYAV